MGTLTDQLRRLAIERRPEACLGCGYEHDCSIHGCQVIKAAAERLDEALKREGERKDDPFYL